MQDTANNFDDDEKFFFDLTRHIITNSSIYAKIVQNKDISAEDIQTAITSCPEENETFKDFAQGLIDKGIQSIAKKVHFELNEEIDSLASKYFKEIKYNDSNMES